MEDDLQLARRAALVGAEVALRHFAALTELRRERKVDGSVVTEADRAVEAAIRDVLGAARPTDAILGEEGGQIDGVATPPADRASVVARRRWIIDPIDGTALFVDGDDRWLVLLALEEDGEVVAGVAVVPAQGRIWWARRGGGAFEADTNNLGAARSVTVGGRRPDAGHPAGAGWRLGVLPAFTDPATGHNVIPIAPEVVAPLLAATPAVPWTLHPPLLVARGDLDVAVQTSGQVWDFAATSLIVHEAGGAYGGLDGRQRPGPGPSVFARSTGVRDEAIRILHGGRPAVTSPTC